MNVSFTAATRPRADRVSWKQQQKFRHKKMYNGIGLTSVRGSGTNGYVQKNMAHVSRQRMARAKSQDAAPDHGKSIRDPRQANPEILEHNRKREVEVKVMKLRVSLEDDDVDEAEIEAKCEELRQSLLKKLPATSAAARPAAGAGNARTGETHADAASKAAENEALKGALGISTGYVGGSAFDRELQARLKEERMAARAAAEEEAEAKRIAAQEELERMEREEEKQRRRDERREEKEARREEKRRRKDSDRRGRGDDD